MVRRRRLGTCCLVALVVLSGCGALSPEPEPTTTVTPVPVPDVSTPEETRLGTDTGETFDGSQVATTHARTLQGTSYTVNQTIVRRAGNGTVTARYVTRGQFSAGGDRANVTLRQLERDGEDNRSRIVRRFQAGTSRYKLLVENETRNLTVGSGPGYGAVEYKPVLANGQAVARVFGLVETRIVDRDIDDGVRYVRVESVEPMSVPPLENVTLTATVSDRGYIRSYRVAYETERDGTRVNAVVELTYSDVGNTTVERPGWVDRAESGG